MISIGGKVCRIVLDTKYHSALFQNLGSVSIEILGRMPKGNIG